MFSAPLCVFCDFISTGSMQRFVCFVV